MPGPGGYEAALVATQLGADVTVVDSDGLGGACVLTDCVPSKTLIESSSTMTSLGRAASLLAAVPGVSEVEASPDYVGFAVSDEDDLRGVTKAFAGADLLIRSLVPEQLTLERVFFELTEDPAPVVEEARR